MRIVTFAAMLLLTCICVSLVGQEPDKGHIPGSATLKMRIVYRGERPKLPPIDASKDPACAKPVIPNEILIVGNEGAIQNVALIWDEKRNAKLKVLENDESWRDKVVELRCEDCRFEPHILVMRAGQKVKVVCVQTSHSANFGFFQNLVPSFSIPAGVNKSLLVSKPEPAPVTIECNIHPWMRAYLIVKEHPYVGISDMDGAIEIDNLPVGENVFQLWHEAITKQYENVVHNGVERTFERRRMTFDLAAGLNDLGTIEFKADQFPVVQK